MFELPDINNVEAVRIDLKDGKLTKRYYKARKTA